MHTEASNGTEGPRHGPNERRSAEHRREQLLDAAVAVIAEQGLARATTRAITDRAGLALGAFHYVFESKDELLEAVAQRVVHDIDASLTDTMDPGPADAEADLVGEELIVAQLRSFLLRAWRAFERSRSLHLAQYELTLHALRDPERHHLAVQQYALLVSRVSELVHGRSDTVSGDAERELSRFVVATLDGLLLQWLVQQDDSAAEGRLRRYLDVLPAVVATHGTS